MTTDDRPSDQPATSRIQVWLELDLDTLPIKGTLSAPDCPPIPFVGWLGLTAALEGLRTVGDGSSDE